MYCSNCGNQIKAELNFCNRCGAKVFRAADVTTAGDTQKTVSRSLAESLGYVGGFGLIGFIFVALVLVKHGVGGLDLLGISFLYLGALFGVCFLILQQIKIFSVDSANKEAEFGGDFQTDRRGAAHTARLEEPKQQPISVTETTTRNFEKVPLKEK